MYIFLIRHGQTEWNTLKKIQGREDIPLSPEGHLQAQRCGEVFKRRRLAAVMSSPLSRAVETAGYIAGAAGVDIQGYTFDLPSKTAFVGEDKYSFTKDNPKEVVTDSAVIDKQCEFIERVHGMGAEVLLSCHPGIPMKREQVVELALFLEKREPDIIKIVSIANTEEDMLESLHAMRALKREVKTPVSYHAGGKFGALSRVLCPVLGGQIAFCVDRFSESSTLEQLELASAKTTIEELKKLI